MANKRDLKKRIRCFCGDIAGECIIARAIVPGIDVTKMSDIVVKVAFLQEEALKRISFSFDKCPSDFPTRHDYNKARRAYNARAYKSLTDEFNSLIEDIVKEMNQALPAEQKAANKKAVAK